MSTQSPHAVTGGDCVLCDGPCREPFKLDPVPTNYPFMSAAHIAATQTPAAEEAPVLRQRASRLDRMRRPEHHDRTHEGR